MNTLKPIFILTIGILFGLLVGTIFSKNKSSIAKGKIKCAYTSISDYDDPEIGENGKIKYDNDWSKVIKNNFRLKKAIYLGTYIFEKCSDDKIKYDYTFIDHDPPEIGEKGKIKYDNDWLKVINSGWKLKEVCKATKYRYIFERPRKE